MDFEVGALSLSGRFTTIEGLVTALYDQLKDTLTAFYAGDSQSEDVIAKTNQFLDKLNKIKKCEISVDIILTDPAGNSYIQVNNIQNKSIKSNNHKMHSFLHTKFNSFWLYFY